MGPEKHRWGRICQTFSCRVDRHRFSILMILRLNIFTWPPFIAAWLNVTLALLALFRNPRDPLHRSFAGWNLCMAMWNANNFILYQGQSDPATILRITQWTRDFMV